ncbi:hypothetical protein C8J56DRAFT_1054420 [Mycena floridula]|nr:hypothetical protein C8J56DRAFT_1054420 [Mycena floridula]
MAHATVKDNVFGNIGGDFMSNNPTTVNIYPSVLGPSNSLSRHGRGYMPASSTLLYGRDPDLDFIVERLIWEPETPASKRARFALLGTGGMGKSSLALKVMRDARLLSCYPEFYQAWLPCVQATSFSLLLDTIYSALDIQSDTKNTLNDILNELRLSKPIILLFDNFETPWNTPGARADVAQFLQDIDAIPHVAIFVTMRATVAPCEEISWTVKRIKPLDPEASYQLYTEIDIKAGNNEKVSELLDMLGHMPLAVKLMARQGNSTGCTVEELTESYRKIGTAMLGPSEGSDPQNSISISISMSLDSPQVKREHNAVLLLRRISLLPAGTSFQILQRWWASDLANLQSALQALLEVSLLERRNTRYFVLPVIRSHLLNPVGFPGSVRDSMIQAACSFLLHHNSPLGAPNYKDDAAARSNEEINLQSILLATNSSKNEFIEALEILAWHQYRIRPRTEVIEHAVKLVQETTNRRLAGEVLGLYSDILYIIDRLEESLEQLKLARQAYLAASEPRHAALTLLDIAFVSVSLDPQTKEIPLIEQAILELETIQRNKPYCRRHLPGSFSYFRHRCKTVSPKALSKAKSTMDGADMARCLRDLGSAYSRQGDHYKAIEHLIRARELRLNLSFEGATCAQDLAMFYHRLQQHQEAEKWGLLASKEFNELGDSDIGGMLWLLGRIYISKGQYDRAIEYLSQGLDRATSRNDHREAVLVLLELGRAYFKKGETEKARACLKEALSYSGRLEGMAEEMVICKFYLQQLDDRFQAPSEEQRRALRATWHVEDITS